jgi:Ca2+/H+ antiporter, TMEM165/GDT1 family
MNTEMYSSPYRKRKWMFFLLIIPLVVLAFSYLVMFLWNAILPEVVHVNPITYWQAMGLLVLSRLLFGGFGFRGNHHHHHVEKAREIREKWKGMSEEEKAQFKEEWRNRCNR